MSYEIFTIPAFDRAAKRLRKKYRNIGSDLGRLVNLLADNPLVGTAIPGFGHQVWKIRLASVDMQVGKRGGYRVIYALNSQAQSCYLLFVYAKPDKSDVSPGEIEDLLLDLENFLNGLDDNA